MCFPSLSGLVEGHYPSDRLIHQDEPDWFRGGLVHTQEQLVEDET